MSSRKAVDVEVSGLSGGCEMPVVLDSNSLDNPTVSHPAAPAPVSSEDEIFNHDLYPPMEEPICVPYCPRCGFPPDFCDFGRCWSECQSEALAKYPQYYAHSIGKVGGAPTASADTAAVRDVERTSNPTQPSSASVAPPATTKSKKKEPAPVVTIQRVSRAKHKMATIVYGIDSFGVKLENAAKIFKKHFACGSSAVKGLPGQQDHVEIQGDFEWEVEELLLNRFPEIPEEALVHLKPK